MIKIFNKNRNYSKNLFHIIKTKENVWKNENFKGQ